MLDATGEFFKVFFGGIIVGLLISRLVAYIIGRLHDMPLIKITLTVCLAYFAFLLAEHYLHVSGVMAVVTAGLVIRSIGRTKMVPATWHALVETWEQLGFWANSLIFFLVGLLVPRVLIDFTEAHAITLAVLIVAAFTARAVVLYGVLPLLNLVGLGERISLAFRTVMWWGGLRGAVALALALLILETPGVAPETQTFIVVLVTGFVLFTLFVNATTIKLVMGVLGLNKLPSTDLMIRNRVMALALSNIRKDVERAAQDYRIDPAIASKVATDYDQRLAEIKQAMAKAGKIPDQDLQRIGLTILTTHEHELYLQHFSEGLISARITRMLLVQADNLLDALKEDGLAGYQGAVNRALGFGLPFYFTLALQRRLGLTGPLAAQLANRFEMLRATQAVVRDLLAFTQEKTAALLGKPVARELESILTTRFEETWQALQGLRLQYPEYARLVQERHLARVALRLEGKSYRHMLHEHVIGQEVFNNLMHDLDKRARALERQPQLDLGLDPGKLVAKVPFFADLDPERIAKIAKRLKPRLVVPGERVIRKGETGDAMYFISTGTVEVAIESEPVQLGSGEFFGEIGMLTERPRRADVTALSYCQLLVLSARDFRRLLAAHPHMRETITRVARERLGTWFQEPGHTWSEDFR